MILDGVCVRLCFIWYTPNQGMLNEASCHPKRLVFMAEMQPYRRINAETDTRMIECNLAIRWIEGSLFCHAVCCYDNIYFNSLSQGTSHMNKQIQG